MPRVRDEPVVLVTRVAQVIVEVLEKDLLGLTQAMPSAYAWARAAVSSGVAKAR